MNAKILGRGGCSADEQHGDRRQTGIRFAEHRRNRTSEIWNGREGGRVPPNAISCKRSFRMHDWAFAPSRRPLQFKAESRANPHRNEIDRKSTRLNSSHVEISY